MLTLAALAAPIHRRLGSASGWLFGLTVAGVGAWFAAGLPLATELREQHAWVPTLALSFDLRLDGLAMVFALLITGVGALVLIHAGGYLEGDPRRGRFHAFLLLFLAAMLGVVLSDNLVALFCFWELTSVASYLLIGFDHERAEARRAALTALFITGAGGIAMLAGFVLLHTMGLERGLSPEASWRISALLEVDLRSHALYVPAVLLVLAGALTKSAQMPFHVWLPAAMAAPTPTSALLHSATMVKAGVYLMARLHPALGRTMLWEVVLIGAGATTMIVAAVLSVRQRDLKRVLAYSTVSVLGILTMLIGLGTDLALQAMVVFLVAHALYKAALFLLVGNVEHETGSRDVGELGGLRRAMPYAAITGALAALSKAGAPPLFGFIGKELLYKAKLDLETLAGWLLVVAVAANVLLVASALLVGIKPFWGRERALPKTPHEAPWSMRLGPLVLAVVGLFVGLFPDWFDRTLGEPMAAAVAGHPVPMKLELWYGVSPAALTVLGLSAATLALGIFLFTRLRRRRDGEQPPSAKLLRFGPSRLFDLMIDAVPTVAGAITRRIQTGQLRRYSLVVILVATVAVAVPAVAAIAEEGLPDLGWGAIRLWELGAVGLIVGGAALAAMTRSRLAAVAGLGATGMGVALIFVFFGAPDLAITQLMVETLTVILFVLVFHRMAPFVRRSSTSTRVRDLAVAAAAGATVTLVILAAAAVPTDWALARWFAERSLPEAFGRNVVNVILVDFRALDTLGEITVVAVAGLGVLALLRLRGEDAEERS